ncbi:MAG: hypothetical protein JNL83_23695 [Myxococcales bacterium]|nr:hypothetical protein [Myxococcales bacterium]
MRSAWVVAVLVSGCSLFTVPSQPDSSNHCSKAGLVVDAVVTATAVATLIGSGIYANECRASGCEIGAAVVGTGALAGTGLYGLSTVFGAALHSSCRGEARRRAATSSRPDR